jgi:hypothetical protein
MGKVTRRFGSDEKKFGLTSNVECLNATKSYKMLTITKVIFLPKFLSFTAVISEKKTYEI